jgi:UDP-3-O-[3-hydroxymyristoyl] glucosamine N-acyltransferase
MNHCSSFTFHEPNGVVIPGYRYINPDGSTGGWVAKTAVIGEGAIIDPGAIVAPGVVIEPFAHIVADKIISIDDKVHG